MRLLIDTGSVYTVLPMEVLKSIGCSPAGSLDRVRTDTTVPTHHNCAEGIDIEGHAIFGGASGSRLRSIV